MNNKKKISILGGGPAGMAVAYYAKQNHLDYDIYEKANRLGGNCITIRHGDFLFDSGAHRLHDKDEETTQIAKKLLGNDLTHIQVPSQIFREGKFIDFPLSPLNLLKYLGIVRFSKAGVQILKSTLNSQKETHNFYDLAVNAYGKDIANLFLLHYTEKLWGKPAKELSKEVAGKRLKGLNVKTFLLEAIKGESKKTTHLDGSFYYPKYGIGMLFDALAKEIGEKSTYLNHGVTRIHHQDNKITELEINDSEVIPVEEVISSLPVGLVLKMMNPLPPNEILDLAKSISFRNVLLVAFFLDKESINKNGSMYFPSQEFPFTRIYEPRNRSQHMSPKGKTSLIVEVPCQSGDKIWQQKEEEIINRIQNHLVQANFFTPTELLDSCTYRIYNAYPILENNYEEKTKRLFTYLNKFTNLKMTGRNGLFAYTHIHDHMINARQIVRDI